MTTLIARDTDTITPTLVLGYESEREARTIVHTILGRPDSDVTLRAAALRTGTLTLGFGSPTSETDSKAAEDLHADGGVFALTSDERGTIAMSYVVNGPVMRALDDETRGAWTVAVPFQEVPE